MSANTPVPENTRSCIALAAGKMSDKTNKNEVVGKFKATSAVQIVTKEKKIDHKCCTTPNCNNQSENRPDLLFRAFPSDTTTEEVRGNSYDKR